MVLNKEREREGENNFDSLFNFSVTENEKGRGQNGKELKPLPAFVIYCSIFARALPLIRLVLFMILLFFELLFSFFVGNSLFLYFRGLHQFCCRSCRERERKRKKRGVSLLTFFEVENSWKKHCREENAVDCGSGVCERRG